MAIDFSRLKVRTWIIKLVIGFSVGVGTAEAAVPDRTDPIPGRAQKIDVVEHLSGLLPLEANFVDQGSGLTKLGDHFKDGLPVIVTMNYSSCPMLCSLQLDGLVKALKQAKQIMGRDYRIVTISFDPSDTPEKMGKMRARYLRDYGRAMGEKPWTMMVGDEQTIRRTAEALGIRYSYNEARKEYLHPAVAILATPGAKIARYLYGIEPLSKTIELSLVEASSGRTMTTVDRLVLYCFHYDATEGRYAPVAFNIMRVGSGVTVLLLGSVLAGFWMLELRQRKRMAEVHPC